MAESRHRVGDPVFWLGAASCAGAVTFVAPVLTVAVVALGAFFLFRLRARALVVATVLLFALGAFRGHRAIARYEAARRSVVERGGWPGRCIARGIVARSPTVLGGGTRVDLGQAEVACPSREAIRAHVVIHVPHPDVGEPTTFARGDTVMTTASLAPTYRFFNDGAGDPRPSGARRGVVLSGGAEDAVVERAGSGISSLLDRMRAHARGRIEATFPAETSPMARALVLGEDDLPDVDQQAFRRSGLSHLLAVSGMHLVLVVVGLVAALRAVMVRIPAIAARVDVTRMVSAIGIPIAWAYADVAGGSGSAIRAAWMCTVTLLARVLLRRSSAWRALGISVLGMSLVDPLVAFDVSFLLSALATLGLLALSRPIEGLLLERLCVRGRTLPRFLATPLATTAAATIACAPILATMAPELPLSGLVANVVAVPLGELAALPLCLVHGVLASFPAAERGCATVASGALVLVRVIARSFTWGALPIPPPTAEQLAAVSATALAIAYARMRRWPAIIGAVAIIVLEAAARVAGAPRNVLRVTFIDVGQGDSALVDFPDGSAMLVDGGGLVGSPIDVGERAVGTVLTARRRRELAAVVLSHPHPDHFLGLASALGGRRVGGFWDTGQGENEGTEGAYARLLADLRARDVKVLHPSDLCGSRAIGGAIVDVLAPCPSLVPDRGANDNSFVMRIRFGGRAVLFMGDAEREEERELVERWAHAGMLHADVLKVGHHGSRTSSSAPFLAAVKPTDAVISCGQRNRFGHPHAPTLETLDRAGVRTWRTDRDGSVIVTTDGHSIEVRSALRT